MFVVFGKLGHLSVTSLCWQAGLFAPSRVCAGHSVLGVINLFVSQVCPAHHRPRSAYVSMLAGPVQLRFAVHYITAGQNGFAIC